MNAIWTQAEHPHAIWPSIVNNVTWSLSIIGIRLLLLSHCPGKQVNSLDQSRICMTPDTARLCWPLLRTMGVWITRWMTSRPLPNDKLILTHMLWYSIHLRVVWPMFQIWERTWSVSFGTTKQKARLDVSSMRCPVEWALVNLMDHGIWSSIPSSTSPMSSMSLAPR